MFMKSVFRTQNRPGEAMGLTREVSGSLRKLLTLYPSQLGRCERVRNHAVGWHKRRPAAVRLLKTIPVREGENTSLYTKVPTEISPKGSRDQQEAVYLDPPHSRPGNFVVVFVHRAQETL